MKGMAGRWRVAETPIPPSAASKYVLNSHSSFYRLRPSLPGKTGTTLDDSINLGVGFAFASGVNAF